MRLTLAPALFGLGLLTSCGGATLASSDSTPVQGPLNEWAPRVAIVFPVPASSDSKGPGYTANVSVWPANKVLCDKPPNPEVNLYVAKDFDPGDLVKVQPAFGHHQEGGVAFPTQEFNAVPANMAAEPNTSYTLVAFERGQPASNAWLYGKPPAQYVQVKPTGYGSPDPSALDTRIQVVFPHDDSGKKVSPDQATEINVAVDIFQHGTELSVPPDATDQPTLWLAQGSAPLAALPPGVQKTTYTVNGQGYPRWVFNNVRVDPGQGYHLLAMVGQLGHRGGSYPTIWTHLPAKVSAPKLSPPPACIP